MCVTDAASHPAAEANLGLPGRVRRRDPPGVRWRPGDWRAPPTGYLQGATRDTRGPDDGACAAPCSVRQRRLRPCSPRTRPGQARHAPAGRAGAQTPAAAPRGGRPASPWRTRSSSASVPPREAPAITGAGAGLRRPRFRAGQALTRERPLRRRAARIARPARVRIRSRNPCVFARRRLFGWNVRLLTGTPGTRGRVRSMRPQGPGRPRTRENLPRQVAGQLNGTRAGCRWSNPRPGPAPAIRPAAPATARSPRRLPTARQQPRRHPAQHFAFAHRAPRPTPRLWTARSRARGSGITRPPAFTTPGGQWGGSCTSVQRAQPVDKPVDHMWGREVNDQ
jgi:hypothetical protein